MNATPLPPSLLPSGFYTFLTVFMVIMYLVIAVPLFGMFYKAKAPLPWLALIPIANMFPFFRVIRVNMWNYLWFLPGAIGDIVYFADHNIVGLIIEFVLLIPILVMNIIWYVKLFRAFSMSPLWLLLIIGFIIPLINLVAIVWFIVLLWILGFGKKHPYQL